MRMQPADGTYLRSVFIPGSADGQVDVDGFRIAFEVCFDHCLGRLKRAGTQPHFHIVASVCVANFPDHMANLDGGYFLGVLPLIPM